MHIEGAPAVVSEPRSFRPLRRHGIHYVFRARECAMCIRGSCHAHGLDHADKVDSGMRKLSFEREWMLLLVTSGWVSNAMFAHRVLKTLQREHGFTFFAITAVLTVHTHF
jgi:hypothetical protein